MIVAITLFLLAPWMIVGVTLVRGFVHGDVI
jgi:hypothetical protein